MSEVERLREQVTHTEGATRESTDSLIAAVRADALGFVAAELARGDREARDLMAKVKWPDCLPPLVNLYSDILRSINAYVNDRDIAGGDGDGE